MASKARELLAACPIEHRNWEWGRLQYLCNLVFNGLKIGHCCPGCTKPLLVSPEKLLDKAKIEWREAARAAAKANAAEVDARAEVVAAQGERFRFLPRRPGYFAAATVDL